MRAAKDDYIPEESQSRRSADLIFSGSGRNHAVYESARFEPCWFVFEVMDDRRNIGERAAISERPREIDKAGFANRLDPEIIGFFPRMITATVMMRCWTDAIIRADWLEQARHRVRREGRKIIDRGGPSGNRRGNSRNRAHTGSRAQNRAQDSRREAASVAREAP